MSATPSPSFPGGDIGAPANAGDIRDAGLFLGWGRSPGGGPGTHSGIVAWRIPWTEKIGGLQSIGSQRIRHG